MAPPGGLLRHRVQAAGRMKARRLGHPRTRVPQARGGSGEQGWAAVSPGE